MNKILLTEELARKWLRNLLVFFAPLLVVYFGTVAMVLQQETHLVSFKDFVPNSATVGAIALYVVNGIMDYLRKVRSK